MTKVDEAIVEMDTALAKLEPELEGLYDYRALNIGAPARTEVEESITTYERRILTMKIARSALVTLVTDGHPVLASREIDSEAYANLAENRRTIELALATFSGRDHVAARLGLTASMPVKK